METATNAEPGSRIRGYRQTIDEPAPGCGAPVHLPKTRMLNEPAALPQTGPHSSGAGMGITALRASSQALADGGSGVPSSRASHSQLRQRSPCSRPAASLQQGHAEMPPGPDPAGPGDGLGKVPTTPNMPSWGSVFCGHVPWEPARVPASELLGFLYRGGWEGCCPARSPAHLPPPRVRPLCEPAALWLVSGAASAGGEARARSRGLWRPLAATRR